MGSTSSFIWNQIPRSFYLSTPDHFLCTVFERLQQFRGRKDSGSHEVKVIRSFVATVQNPSLIFQQLQFSVVSDSFQSLEFSCPKHACLSHLTLQMTERREDRI